MKNWNNKEVDIAVSKGGVIALSNPYDNLISTDIKPWPPSDIVQKLYQSRQSRAFVDDQKKKATQTLGFYSDLQSINSEDAITWSVFGTAAHSENKIRNQFVQDFLNEIGIKSSPINNSEIFLWRRIPHPDTLGMGGPEIDFGIYTKEIIIFGEAKWRSSVSTAQGKNKDKDQIQLRVEFLNKFGQQFYPGTKNFAVVGIGLKNDVTDNYTDEKIQCIGITWDEICQIDSHPLFEEVKRYLDWKKNIQN